MDKLAASHLFKEYLMSFEKEADTDLNFYLYAYINEKDHCIHFDPEARKFMNSSLFSSVDYDSFNSFNFISQGSNYLLSAFENPDKNFQGFMWMTFFQKLCNNVKVSFQELFPILSTSRMDLYNVKFNENVDLITHEFSISVYCYEYSAIYVHFILDSQLNLIDVSIGDRYVCSVLDKAKNIQERVNYLKVFMAYFLDESFRKHLLCDYKEIDQHNIESYLTVYHLHKV